MLADSRFLNPFCTPDQIEEAKLQAKNRTVVLEACDELLQLGVQAINAHKEELKRKSDAGETITSNMRQKAVLIEFRAITNINAETVVSRHFDLRAVQETLATVQDVNAWKIPNEHIRPTTAWSVEWGPEQDAKLVVGIWRYGVGSWEQMQLDPSLGFAGKFFLEDQKNKAPTEEGKSKLIPNAVHLVRRGDYLCGLIREWTELSKAYAEQQAQYGPGRPIQPPNSYRAEPSSSKRPRPSAAGPSTQANGDAAGGGAVKRKSTPVYTDSSSDD